MGDLKIIETLVFLINREIKSVIFLFERLKKKKNNNDAEQSSTMQPVIFIKRLAI